MRSQKWTKIGTPLPGISALKSVSGGPFFGHLLIWPDAGRRAAAAAGGRWLLVGQRNVIGASRKNYGTAVPASGAPGTFDDVIDVIVLCVL